VLHEFSALVHESAGQDNVVMAKVVMQRLDELAELPG